MHLEDIDACKYQQNLQKISIVYVPGVVIPHNIVALHVFVIIVLTILVPCLKLHSCESHENEHVVEKRKTTHLHDVVHPFPVCRVVCSIIKIDVFFFFYLATEAAPNSTIVTDYNNVLVELI